MQKNEGPGFLPAPRIRANKEQLLCYFTFTLAAGEVDPLKLASPLYWAEMECVPDDNVEVVNFATPLFTGTEAEIAVVPSKNTTLPVAVFGVMVAVNVASAPALKLSSGAVIATLVEVFCTVTTTGVEVPLLKLASPLYCAVMEWLPALREVAKLAVPLLSGMLPEIAVAPSKKVTLPVAVLGATLAKNVSGVPAKTGFVAEITRRLMSALTLVITVCTNTALVDAAN
jgi:hypothetical protein